MKPRTTWPLLLLCGLSACSEGAPPRSPNGLRVAVAPLSLPGLTEVCYDLRVTNGPDQTGETVWARGTPGLNDGTSDAGALCSSRYGNGAGGDLTYIGPCDADGQLDADPAGERMNSVTLWFDGLYDMDGAYLDPGGASGWQNPCVDATGAEVGCTLNVLCEENADALVEFNFTIMRQANQGFFDVAVNFNDIFCSAKLDTCYGVGTADERPIELLFGPEGGRDHTAVMALACSAAPGEDAATLLHLSEVRVECADGLDSASEVVFVLDPSSGPGVATAAPVSPRPDTLLRWASYFGTEALACPGGSCNKVYWSVALDIEDLARQGLRDCRLSAVASASEADSTGASTVFGTAAGFSGDLRAPSAVYPLIDYGRLSGGVPLVDSAGTTSCAAHALNAAGSLVRTIYARTNAAGQGAGPSGYVAESGAVEALFGTRLCFEQAAGEAPSASVACVEHVCASAGGSAELCGEASCGSGCQIDDRCVPAGETLDGCQLCLPGGAPCLACVPEQDATGWTPLCPEGEAVLDRFIMAEGMSFFVDNPTGAAFAVGLRYLGTRDTAPLVARVYGPDGRLAARAELPEDIDDGMVARDLQLALPAGAPGVYEVVVGAFGGDLSFAVSGGLKYGVAGHGEWLPGHLDRFANAHVWIPPGLATLPIKARRNTGSGTLAFKVTDAAGLVRLDQTLALDTDNAALGTLDVAAAGGEVWRFEVRSMSTEGALAGRYHLDFDGVMPIFCPDEATARAIHGGLEVLADGAIAFHRFQDRAQALLAQYRQLPASAFAVQLPDLASYEVEWLADPVRNYMLMGDYGAYANLKPVLAEQNLDPASPWFGTIRLHRNTDGSARSVHPFADYHREAAFSGSTSEGRLLGREAAMLIAIYDLDAPFNPLYRDPALLNRAVVAALQDLMMIRAHESLVARPTFHFGGERAFLFGDHLESFALLGRLAPQAVREVLREGNGRLVDRMLVSQVGSSANQWAIIMRGIHKYYEGTGDAHYLEWVRRHTRWIVTRAFSNLGQKEGGYITENYGPDATYNGITLSELAEIQAVDPDPSLLEAIRRNYSFFHHTVAPDPLNPTSSGVGSSDFSHRTPGNWWSTQYGGGFVHLAETLPEAGLREGAAWTFPTLARTVGELADAQDFLRDRLRYNPESSFDAKDNGIDMSAWWTRVWAHYPTAPLSGTLPAVESLPFTRNLGDELFAVKRAAYYSLSYAGRPMPTSSRPKDIAVLDPHTQRPFNGGGFSLFWSPGLGASLYGRNFGAFAAHTLIARTGARYEWEDYWSITRTFTEAPAALVTSGTVRNAALGFSRALSYAEDHVDVTLTLSPTANLSFDDLYESFPFRPETRDTQGVVTREAPQIDTLDADGLVTTGPAKAIRFSHPSTDEVHLLIFEEARVVDLGTETFVNSYMDSPSWGRILTELPTTWQAGVARTFRYRLLVTTSAAVPQAIASYAP